MYAVIARNITISDPDRRDELSRRAEAEFIVPLRQAPGFRDSYIIHDETSGITHRISIFESQAHAEAFGASAEAQAWNRTAQELGARNEAVYRGEVVSHVSARE